MTFQFNQEYYDFVINNQEYIAFLEDWSNQMFEYLNGKVNRINNYVELEIYYGVNGSGMFATCKIGNGNIILSICNLLYFHRKHMDYIEFIMMEILYVLIHELSHTDQIIDQELYKTNLDYKNKIESEADYNTILFIEEHKDEMIKLFNLERVFEFLEYSTNSNVFNGEFIKYNRHDLFSYYTTMLQHFSNKFSFSNILEKYLNVLLVINNLSFVVKDRNNFNPDIYSFSNIIKELFNSNIDHIGNLRIMEVKGDTIKIIFDYEIKYIYPITFI